MAMAATLHTLLCRRKDFYGNFGYSRRPPTIKWHPNAILLVNQTFKARNEAQKRSSKRQMNDRHIRINIVSMNHIIEWVVTGDGSQVTRKHAGSTSGFKTHTGNNRKRFV
jgi:hypothetical protein